MKEETIHKRDNQISNPKENSSFSRYVINPETLFVGIQKSIIAYLSWFKTI